MAQPGIAVKGSRAARTKAIVVERPNHGSLAKGTEVTALGSGWTRRKLLCSSSKREPTLFYLALHIPSAIHVRHKDVAGAGFAEGEEVKHAHMHRRRRATHELRGMHRRHCECASRIQERKANERPSDGHADGWFLVYSAPVPRSKSVAERAVAARWWGTPYVDMRMRVAARSRCILRTGVQHCTAVVILYPLAACPRVLRMLASV